MVLNYNDYFHLLSTYSCQALAEHFKYIIPIITTLLTEAIIFLTLYMRK